MKKPLYSIPTMSQIKNIDNNGFKVISTFSGCGGSCLGYRLAGFDVIWANEFIKTAQETYKLNHPSSILNTLDIRKINAIDILKQTNLSEGELDLFDGSPPCSSFSTAGKREKGWGEIKPYSETKQRTDDLFFEYIRILNELKPKVFVAENVSGLIKGSAKGYFKQIINKLKECGYCVGAQVLNAMWLGVPQARERLIFIGVRSDLNINPVFPRPLKYYYTIEDAWESLKDEKEESDRLQKLAKKYKWSKVLQKIEKNPRKVKHGSSVMNGSYFNLSRLSWNRPANTICQMNGKPDASANCHPSLDRKLTIAELKRVSGFPDDFELIGTFEQQWERIGRAVPPVMMMHIAKTIEREILCRII
jgi:DNA (cytosine-5)-methyltransferase 1